MHMDAELFITVVQAISHFSCRLPEVYSLRHNPIGT